HAIGLGTLQPRSAETVGQATATGLWISRRQESGFPDRVPPRVRFKKKKYCPECGKNVTVGEVDEMRDACTIMWRKFMRLGDQHCPLFKACEVKTLAGHDEEFVPE
ncbi:unnamed protein product, partial [Polarella glacialis]